MNDMTKHQLVLLILLVSFVTALVTGIVTVTLINQAPAPITQTIQRVVEKTIGALPEPLKKNEKQELELSALSRDILIEDIARRVSPAVVSVVATKDIPVIERYFVSPFSNGDPLQQFFPDLQIPQYRQKGTEKTQVSSGSGFFVSSDGFLLTNRHVVEDSEAEYSVITNDNKKLKAKVVARDTINDMAVLKIDGGDFASIPLGDSESVSIGQTAIAIGNALGEFQNTVSIGVVSGLRRTIMASGSASGPEELSQVIQTDAAINLGNSGGPLLNLRGEAIGLNAAKAQGAENIGFSIPINQLKRALNDARTKGRIINPYIGVRYILADNGALVQAGANGEDAIQLNSPASRAGIKEGDVILEFGGVKITRENPLNKLIQQRSVGDKVTLKILRDGKEIKIDLVLEERKNI
ncbi:MAG: trypsin-like peptidase domain-containing protein [Candidatus Giovannonibacteria bacterium]|nr:trypsin-like peptidase domain-containing protein [Candidatus Giovannonibacteria bacterium]